MTKHILFASILVACGTPEVEPAPAPTPSDPAPPAEHAPIILETIDEPQKAAATSGLELLPKEHVFTADEPNQVFTLRNLGTVATSPIENVVDGSGYTIVDDSCTGRAIPSQSTCAIVIRFDSQVCGDATLTANGGDSQVAGVLICANE